VEHLYHARPNQPPSSAVTALTTTAQRYLYSEDQPYLRQLLVGPEWERLDTGWVKAPGLIHLRNEEEPAPTTPTGEPLPGAEPKVVELGVLVNGSYRPVALVHPLFSQRVDPPPDQVYGLRCPTGRAQVTLTVLPG
jgi:hypothetical protein